MAAARDIDALYQLPLGEFTAARNALAARLKKDGHIEEARRIQALAKPSVPAWAVNQLYWRHRGAFDQLLAAGDRFRNAQRLQLAGKAADVRAPLEARREAVGALTKVAATLLRAGGHNPTPETMRRVTTTLDALATYGAHPPAPAAGRLADDIEPPGFEALAELVPRPGQRGRAAGEPPRVIPFRTGGAQAQKKRERRPEDDRKARLQAAQAALRDAERALREARRHGEQAETALKKAAARAKDTERKKAALEARLEKATAAADQARLEARRVASAAEEAAQAIDEAERAVEHARRELHKLRG